ncbi:MAG: phosphoadenosine phosphosulfate reductase family protein [Lutimonas sp.]
MNVNFSYVDLSILNAELRHKEPFEIIRWAINSSKRPILTTNFGPYSASLIHAVNSVKKDIEVVWVDTGYNTPHTYRYANKLINRFKLNMKIFVPKTTTAYRDVVFGIPEVGTEAHQHFTNEVKIEPFRRALSKISPDVWFTNIRKCQTEHRNSLDIVTMTKEGIIKISPFFYWNDTQIELYLKANELPNEFKYFDPTKVFLHRECGIHL